MGIQPSQNLGRKLRAPAKQYQSGGKELVTNLIETPNFTNKSQTLTFKL